jgi:hypothetical protein
MPMNAENLSRVLPAFTELIDAGRREGLCESPLMREIHAAWVRHAHPALDAAATEAWPPPQGTPQVEHEAAAWRLTMRALARHFDHHLPLDADLARLAERLDNCAGACR